MIFSAYIFARRFAAMLAVFCLLLSGCVATGTSAHDPYESWNRAVFKFNTELDSHVFKPAAITYRRITPSLARKGVSNVYDNFGELGNLVNSALQGKGTRAFKTGARFVINTTLGIFGLFDVAQEFGIRRHQEDFGQTLAFWGIESGPYLMLPVMGPSNMRDMFGMVPNSFINAVPTTAAGVDTWQKRGFYLVGYGLDVRQSLLDLEQVLESSGLDPYIAIRENYIAYRQREVNDGVVQPTTLTDEEQDLLFGDFDDEAIQ